MSRSVFEELERAEAEAEAAERQRGSRLGRTRRTAPTTVSLYDDEDEFDIILRTAEEQEVDEDSEKEYESGEEPDSDIEEGGESYITTKVQYSDLQRAVIGKGTSVISTAGGGAKMDRFYQKQNIINMTVDERTDAILEIECQKLEYTQAITKNIVEVSKKDKLRSFRNPSLYCTVINAFVREPNPRKRQSPAFINRLYKPSRFQQIDVYRYIKIVETLF
jgi:hypothetical protein